MLLTCLPAWAQQSPDSAEKKTEPAPAATSAPKNDKFPAPPAQEKTSKTQHTIRLNGQDLHYTAVAGTLVLKKDDGNGEPSASIFYIAYSLDGADAAKRPVTFTFNGGPGSSSVWLHMGALGPRRVELTSEGMAVPPPYHLVDNEQSALAFTDLVFIDPVTTGFSRHAPGEDPKQFHGLEEDLRSVSNFIQLYLTKYQRWSSPKFLAGESYGTTRAAGLSKALLENHGIYLNGITLISSVLNFQTLSFEKGNDLPYVLFLPSYTATAWYHHKLSGELQSGDIGHAVQQARDFASTTYEQALMKGDKLTDEERKKVVQQVASFTGLPEQFVDQANLRISDGQFFKELLRGEGEVIGRYDSRLTAFATDRASDNATFDPSYSAVQGAFTAAFNEYVRHDLKWETDIPYNILTPKVSPWNMSEFTNSYVNVATRLKEAMTQNTFLHVLQMNGYYDLATPFFATEYTFDHMSLAKPLRTNVSMGYCGAGHMLYLKSSCREELHKDMAHMYGTALAPSQPAQ